MQAAIVIHYHELWLKGGNRRFFIGKLFTALRQALAGLPIQRIEQPGDRLLIRLGDPGERDAGQLIGECVERIERVSGVAYYGIARPAERSVEAICAAAWEEIEPLRFSTFAVRARRSDKSFPHSSMEMERTVGRFLLDRLAESRRETRVQLKEPDVTCHIEITPGPALVYARKITGAGGLPPNTAGRIVCLLSGGFDSAVAAWQLMKRGAHLSFIHFYSAGARAGESSLHVASGLVRQLTPRQFHAKLYRIPFEGIQREIVRCAPEDFRILLYRRMMLRISEVIARREKAAALATGDSLGQVASQTLRNLAAVDSVARLPVFRPLIGADKVEILETARKIGTYEISAEPFHDCCPVFLPKRPALAASVRQLDEAESKLDLPALVATGLAGASTEKFTYSAGRVESDPARPFATTDSSSRRAFA